jgi:hypothetical protein
MEMSPSREDSDAVVFGGGMPRSGKNELSDVDDFKMLCQMPDSILGIIIDRLTPREVAALCVSMRRVWMYEKTHVYTKLRVFFDAAMPAAWFAARAGRVAAVEFAVTQAAADPDGDILFVQEEEEKVIMNLMNAMCDAGARVSITTDTFIPIHQRVSHIEVLFSVGNGVGFNWETVSDGVRDLNVTRLSRLFRANPECTVALVTGDCCGAYERGEVLRQIHFAAPLAPYASRIDMSKFDIPVRHYPIPTRARCIGTWAEETFPTARVFWCNPAWTLYYESDDSELTGSEYDEIDSEEADDVDDADGDEEDEDGER